MKWNQTGYLFLLVYIFIAITFWGITLYKQSNLITKFELEILSNKGKTLGDLVDLKEQENVIVERQRTRSLQYIGEGAIILIITIIASIGIYRNIRRRRKLTEMQHNFMLSVTHELKSPIAGIKLNLQTLLRPNVPDDKKGALISRGLSEADRLNNLCNNLLLATQFEGNETVFSQEEINFSDLCYQIIEEYASRSSHTLKGKIEADIYSHGDLLLWKIAISNLIENAIKYSDKDTVIVIDLHKDEYNNVLSIADNGIGIPDDEKHKIFSKFYRVGNENSRKTKGTGLGLYLTAEIIKLQEANISIKDNEPNGTVFEIILP